MAREYEKGGNDMDLTFASIEHLYGSESEGEQELLPSRGGGAAGSDSTVPIAGSDAVPMAGSDAAGSGREPLQEEGGDASEENFDHPPPSSEELAAAAADVAAGEDAARESAALVAAAEEALELAAEKAAASARLRADKAASCCTGPGCLPGCCRASTLACNWCADSCCCRQARAHPFFCHTWTVR